MIDYNTAIVFKDNTGNYIHRTVALNPNGTLLSISLNKIKEKFGVNVAVNKPIYKHTFITQSEALKAQRIGNTILKLFYNAGNGTGSVSDLDEKVIKYIYSYAENKPSDEDITLMYNKIYESFEKRAAKRYDKNVNGILYVMKDYDMSRQ